MHTDKPNTVEVTLKLIKGVPGRECEGCHFNSQYSGCTVETMFSSLCSDDTVWVITKIKPSTDTQE